MNKEPKKANCPYGNEDCPVCPKGKHIEITEDYTYHPREFNNTCCKYCGIMSFSHFHKKGTKPKDFERIASEPVKNPNQFTCSFCQLSQSTIEKTRVPCMANPRGTWHELKESCCSFCHTIPDDGTCYNEECPCHTHVYAGVELPGNSEQRNTEGWREVLFIIAHIHGYESDAKVKFESFIDEKIEEAIQKEREIFKHLKNPLIEESYAEGYSAGQKNAFGVDRKSVKEEGIKEERERIIEIVKQHEDGYSEDGACSCGKMILELIK